ncbi:acyltransferase family protein, partial [Photorhabdus thracensis]
MHLNKRIDWVDSLKFLGMFYIYIGHLGQSAGNIYPFVFSFHVPLFFFISGLFFSSTENNRKLMNSVYKSFKGILIPYFIFSFISVIIISIQNSASPHEVFEMVKLCLLGVRNNIPAGSLWFLPCLFLVVLYQSFLFRVLKSNV